MTALAEIAQHYQARARCTTDMWPHMPTLARYASYCKHITEFGVGPEHLNLNSTWAWLYGLTQSPEQEKSLLLYDLFPNKHIDDVMRLAEAVGIRCEFTLANSLEITIEPTHLLFIDTEHTYQHCLAELERHQANVQGFIILHDTAGKYAHWEDWPYNHERRGALASHPEWYGMWPAVESFLERHVDWRLYERDDRNAGITILTNLGEA